jgi:uncharacterized membrane protein
MPVCSRCFGAGLGQAFALLLLLADALPSYFIGCMCMPPMVIDWLLQEYLAIESNNLRRLVTGLVGGLGVGCVTFKLVMDATSAVLLGLATGGIC